MVVVPPVAVNEPSTLMPLPPAPVLVRVSLPPLMVMLPSALRHEAAFVFTSSLSHTPPPLVEATIVVPLMRMSPSDLIHFAAAAVTLTLIVPPSR